MHLKYLNCENLSGLWLGACPVWITTVVLERMDQHVPGIVAGLGTTAEIT